MKSFFTKWGLTISLIVISIHLISQFLGEEFRLVEMISKGLFLPSLMMYLYVQDNVSNKPGKNLVMIALFGSFLGDVFLLSKSLFIPGMVAFMSTHIVNIIFFSKIYGLKQPKSIILKASTFLLLSFCWFIYFQLSTAIGPLIYPILV